MSVTISQSAERFHDISCGHRVVGQGGKCENLHGHNYRIHFECQSQNGLDDVGRAIDFGEIKRRLCNWLEEHWDHKFLVWEADPWAEMLAKIDHSVVWLSFNPTAENMATFLLTTIGPNVLHGTGVVLVSCKVEETRKCSASVHFNTAERKTTYAAVVSGRIPCK